MGIAKKAILESSSEEEINKTLAELSKEAALNVEEIARVVEWTNTLKQLKLFKEAKDKTEEFPVADASEIKNLIYGEQDLEKESYFNDPYKLPENLDLTKSASLKTSHRPIRKSNYPLYKPDLVKQAYTHIDRAKKVEVEAKVERDIAETKFYGSMMKIARNLDNLYSERFSEFEQASRDAYGNKVLPLLEQLSKMARANNERLLNYTPKNVIKETENLKLLKEAVTNMVVYECFEDVQKYASTQAEEWKDRIASYEQRLA